jgi:hypothetical protein
MKQVMKYIPLVICVFCVVGVITNWQQNTVGIWAVALTGWVQVAFAELTKGKV